MHFKTMMETFSENRFSFSFQLLEGINTTFFNLRRTIKLKKTKGSLLCLKLYTVLYCVKSCLAGYRMICLAYTDISSTKII